MNLKSLFLIMLVFLFAGPSAVAQQVPDNNTGINAGGNEGNNSGAGPQYREKFYPNGNLMYQGTFMGDIPAGEMKRYNENGVLQAILDYDEDGRSVRAVLFYEDGTRAAEGRYTDMQKDSVWKYYSYYDSQLAAEEYYLQGKLNGPLRSFYSNGNVSEVVEWVDGERNGVWEQYFDGGRSRLSAHYQDDMLEGTYTVYAENGSPSVTGSYAKNQRHGLWTFYGEDGAVEAELHYEHGKNLDPDVTVGMQEDLFRRIDENMGKFEEPDEAEFLMPATR